MAEPEFQGVRVEGSWFITGLAFLDGEKLAVSSVILTLNPKPSTKQSGPFFGEAGVPTTQACYDPFGMV